MEEEIIPVALSADAASTPLLAIGVLVLAMALCVAWHIWRTRDLWLPELAPVAQHPSAFDEDVEAAEPLGAHGVASSQSPSLWEPLPETEPEPAAETAAVTDTINIPVLAHAAATGLGQAAWTLPFVILLGVAAIWCSGDGITLKDTGLLTTYTLALTTFGLVALARRPLMRWIASLPTRTATLVCIPRDVLALVIAAVCSVIALELPYNSNFPTMALQWVALEFALALTILVVLYFLAQRFGAGPILGVAAFTVYGIAQHFVALFKSAPVLPSDLLALGTAAEVSGGYTYELTDELLLALIAAAGAVCLLMFVRPVVHRAWKSIAINAGANLCLFAACLGGLSAWYQNVDFAEDLDFVYDYWWPLTMYSTQGSLPSFTAVLKDLPIDQPEGYSDEQAQAAQDNLSATYEAGRGASPERVAAAEQFNQVKPTVIAIMNETFSDLSSYDGLRAGYTGPALYNSLPDALSRGSLAVSVCGGGTANSEFEFLTGTSIAFVGGGKYPYTLYNFEDVNSLAKQFSELGYTTTAMHPNAPNNWNRATVYRQLGFDDFLSIDDFAGAPTFHSGVTDGATYNKILELMAASDEPQFIFDVTMQNHSGYDPYGIPAEQIPSYAPEGVTDANLLSQLNVYLSCIEASDRDLGAFLDQLRTIGKPVVVIFFGDHQPNFVGSLNDVLFPGEDALVHSERTLQTTYTVWANYDIAGNDQVSALADASASTLAAQALDMIGAPLTPVQQAQLAARDSIPQLNIGGYRGADGVWYALDAETPYSSLVNDLAQVSYLNFARAVE